MTREEAIKVLENATIEPTWGGSFRATSEALTMAIEALKRERTDEWCTDCKEYDTEKNCCPRFNRVIREALKREPNEDGTLEVKVEDATKIGRVLIIDDKHSGGLYYPDEYEPQGDLISKGEALMEARPEYLNPEQIGHEEYNKGWSDAISMYWNNLKNLPTITQDRPTDGDLISRAEAIRATTEYNEMPTENCYSEYNHGYKNGMNMAAHFLENMPSADRPRGYWIGDKCSVCGEERAWYGSNPPICPDCGADMRGEDE